MFLVGPVIALPFPQSLLHPSSLNFLQSEYILGQNFMGRLEFLLFPAKVISINYWEGKEAKGREGKKE